MRPQDNVQQYLNACARLGMPDADRFVLADLIDRRYLPAVLHNILALKKIAASRGLFSPALQSESGAKSAFVLHPLRCLEPFPSPSPLLLLLLLTLARTPASELGDDAEALGGRPDPAAEVRSRRALLVLR